MNYPVALLVLVIVACDRLPVASQSTIPPDSARALPHLLAGPGIGELEVAWFRAPDATCPEGAVLLTLTAASEHGFYVGAMPSGVIVGDKEASFVSGSGAVERWVLYGTLPENARVLRGMGSGQPMTVPEGCTGNGPSRAVEP